MELTCTRSVVDYSQRQTQEARKYFLVSTNERLGSVNDLCGFYKVQLEQANKVRVLNIVVVFNVQEVPTHVHLVSVYLYKVPIQDLQIQSRLFRQ
jgi:hypothetical protein